MWSVLILWDISHRSVEANSGNGMVVYPCIGGGSGLVSGFGVGLGCGQPLFIVLVGGCDMFVVCVL